MELTILVDNNVRRGYDVLAEFGLSFLIEDEHHKILFDCGYSNVFLRNAYRMNIGLSDVSDIVLSHSHNDHTGGFLHLQNYYKKLIKFGFVFHHKRVLAHPHIFKPHYDRSMRNIGYPGDENDICDFFDLHFTTEVFKFTDNLVYLGEFPNAESCIAPEESALVYNSREGLVLITGCSHAGVANIVEYAKKVMNENKIHTIVGGMHICDKTDAEIKNLAIYLQEQGVEEVYPCHCCDLRARLILSKYLLVKETYSGMKLHF